MGVGVGVGVSAVPLPVYVSSSPAWSPSQALVSPAGGVVRVEERVHVSHGSALAGVPPSGGDFTEAVIGPSGSSGRGMVAET